MATGEEHPKAPARERELEIYASLAERLAGGGRTYRAAILLGIGAGVVFALAGVVLALLGISGAVEFVLESTSVKARLTNASPGVVIAAMGMIIIWRYKPDLSHDIELRPRSLRSAGGLHAPPAFSNEADFFRGPDDPTFRSKGRS